MALDSSNFGYLLPASVQILSHNGKPITGGHIEIYYSGTDNKYISYSDFDGTQNPFSIPIPNDGRVIVLADIGYKYDIYVYDSYRNPVFSRTNVLPIAEMNFSLYVDSQYLHFVKTETGYELETNFDDFAKYSDPIIQSINDKVDKDSYMSDRTTILSALTNKVNRNEAEHNNITSSDFSVKVNKSGPITNQNFDLSVDRYLAGNNISIAGTTISVANKSLLEATSPLVLTKSGNKVTLSIDIASLKTALGI